MRLSDLVTRVRFPLLGFPAGWWTGALFVAQVRSIKDDIRSVQLVYETPTGDEGLLVSHLAPEPAHRADPLRLTDHLAGFVSHFEPGPVSKRVRRGKAVFPEGTMESEDRVGMVCGNPTAVRVLRHTELPLNAVRTAVVANAQAVDLCVAGWRRDAEASLPALQWLTVEAVLQFDEAAGRTFSDSE